MERQNEESGLSVDEAPRVVKRGRTIGGGEVDMAIEEGEGRTRGW